MGNRLCSLEEIYWKYWFGISLELLVPFGVYGVCGTRSNTTYQKSNITLVAGSAIWDFPFLLLWKLLNIYYRPMLLPSCVLNCPADFEIDLSCKFGSWISMTQEICNGLINWLIQVSTYTCSEILDTFDHFSLISIASEENVPSLVDNAFRQTCVDMHTG